MSQVTRHYTPLPEIKPNQTDFRALWQRNLWANWAQKLRDLTEEPPRCHLVEAQKRIEMNLWAHDSFGPRGFLSLSEIMGGSQNSGWLILNQKLLLQLKKDEESPFPTPGFPQHQGFPVADRAKFILELFTPPSHFFFGASSGIEIKITTCIILKDQLN